MQDKDITAKYGANFFSDAEPQVIHSRDNDLYTYRVYNGAHEHIGVAKGDSIIFLADDKKSVHWLAGECSISSKYTATVIRGYSCGDKSLSLNLNSNLPYVNGCSTRQLFAPERLGDPTLQLLTMPPHTSEQMHHIHSTARVVYVLKGNGYSIVGQSDEQIETPLVEGTLCVLHPMCPHHFRTTDNWLTVLPIHIFSSVAGLEKMHPMFNGTHEIK